MPIIRIVYDPYGISKKKTITCCEYDNLFNILIKEYGPDGFSVPTEVFSGHVSEKNKIDLNIFVKKGYIISFDEIITIIHTPLGSGVLLFVAAAAFGIKTAIDLFNPPAVPEFQKSQESPNNQLSGQTNVARPLQRIPDIYGKCRVYPDLLTPSYSEYVGNVKVLTEYACIGRGEYLVEDLKSGDTLISDIAGASATVYEPFTIPGFLIVRDTNEVNGQEIGPADGRRIDIQSVDSRVIAVNQFRNVTPGSEFSEFNNLNSGDVFNISGMTISGYTYSTTNSDVSFLNDRILFPSGSQAPTWWNVGDILTISETVSNNIIVEISAIPSTNRVDCIVICTGAPVVFINESNVSARVTASYSMDGNYTFNSAVEAPAGTWTVTISESTLLCTPNSDYIATYTNDMASETIGPFNVPGTPEGIWIDISAPQGIQANSGASLSIDFQITFEPIDSTGTPNGNPETHNFTLSGKTTSEQNLTQKFLTDLTDNRYRATITRTSNGDFGSNAREQIKWLVLNGIETVSVSDYGNITSILIQTVATEQATKIQEKKFNAVVTRKLITYNTTTDTLTTTPAATAKFADAALNILTDPYMGNKDVTQIDLDNLYGIQDGLDVYPIYGDTLGRFCYSYSNTRTSVADELITCVNSARVSVLQEGDVMKFVRDELQVNRLALFNRRNKKPNSEKKTIKFHRLSDSDGITLDWIDEDTGEGNTIVFPESSTPVNPKKLKGAGIRNYFQAWNRAKLEYQKLIYQRRTISTTVTKYGLLNSIGDKIANVDGTNVKTQDGEVAGIDGLIVDTSEKIDFQGEVNATVILTDIYGVALAPIDVTVRIDTEKGFILAELPVMGIVIRGDMDTDTGEPYQIGTLYSFAPDSNHLADDYVIQEIVPDGHDYVDLILVNYSDNVYDGDTETPT